jgi:hydroxymethylglutaryl-CoA lyase
MSSAIPAWPAAVTVCEVGLRDGLQNEKTIPRVEQKLQLLNAVVGSGICIIGRRVRASKAVPQMADTDALCRAMQKVDGVEYRALVPNLKGVQRAFEAGVTKAKLTVSASEAHCLANLNSTPVKVVEGFADCADFAAKNDVVLSGAISTSFGCPFIGKCRWRWSKRVQLRGLGITSCRCPTRPAWPTRARSSRWAAT